ncbi:MAG: phosphatidylglycerophosphatase A [Holosporales bacterium]|nr:phosphatidylglycerophosphatase A [Holosporales bacterium]
MKIRKTDQSGKPRTKDLCLLIASFFGIGLISRKMPGTVGSLAATVIVLLSPKFVTLMLVLSAVTFLVGTIACIRLLSKPPESEVRVRYDSDSRDPGYVVIDEVCGVFLGSSIIFSYGLTSTWAIIINFLLFRFFDIVKPCPIRNVEAHLKRFDKTAGFGIMLDDVLAAIIASSLQVLWSILWGK